MKNQLLTIGLGIAFALSGCGGGSGGESENTPSEAGQVTSPVLTPSSMDEENSSNPTEQLSLLKQFRLADGASEFGAVTFALSDWNPRAIAVHGDILYIANSNAAAQILRYDLKTKRVLSSINPEQVGGIQKVWDTLQDISIYKDRLYVASFPSNRVDIFDIGSGEPQFVMSLGTGNWGGDQLNAAIVHTHAVAANDQYVFAPDIQSRINVWQQSEVTSSNHLKARKYARLSLPNCERSCDVRLETVGDLLYASTGNGNTYVYDLSNLAQGASNVAPTRQQNGVASVFHQATDGLLYASRTSGAIESFATENLGAIQDVLSAAIDSVKSYRLQGQDIKLNLEKAADIAVYDKNILSLVGKKIIALPMRNVAQQKSNMTSIPVQLKQAQAISSYKVLQDGESWETLINANERYVFMDQILSAEFGKDSIRIQSYSAVPVADLEIRAKLKNTEQWFVLAKLDHLDAFSNISLKLPIGDNSRFNLVNELGSIRLEGLGEFQQMPVELFDFKIVSETDAHVQKLNKIKAKWKIYFGDYNRNLNVTNWYRITPLYAREWIIMMTNFAYTLSSPEFEHLWFNHQKVMGHEFFGNAGRVNGVNGFFGPADYSRIYQAILNRGGISLGISNIGGGLGGGSTLGVDPWIYYGHYRWSGLGIVAHEFGHHFGSHDSAWANDSYGFQPMIADLFFYMQRHKDMPYIDPNVNKLHLAKPDQLYGSVNTSMVARQPGTTPLNKIDHYFANNPLTQ